MKIKNKDLNKVSLALFSLGNHQQDIKKRWEISKITKPVNEAVKLLDLEVQGLINEKGIEKDGQKTLSVLDADYVDLMNCDIDVECKKMTLDYLEEFNPTFQELLELEAIISE